MSPAYLCISLPWTNDKGDASDISISMADPLSITCGILALITVALSSTVKLTQTIRSFQAHDKRTLALKRELVDLATVLESFHEVVSASPDVNFDSLKTPLDRCGRACEEYGQLIARFTKHSTEQRPSIRDWVTQKYLWGDMADFKDMLASYKSIISIAIANANMYVESGGEQKPVGLCRMG